MTEKVPDNLVGVWHRESLQVADAAPFEDSQVVWIQARSHFADVRVGLPGSDASAESFGGRLSWQEPELVFRHDIDLTGSFTDDVGILSFEGDVLIEEGSVELGKKVINYRERWLRQTDPDPGFCVFLSGDVDSPDGLIVKVADKAIVMMSGISFLSAYLVTSGSKEVLWGVGSIGNLDIPAQAKVGQTVTMGGLSFTCIDTS